MAYARNRRSLHLDEFKHAHSQSLCFDASGTEPFNLNIVGAAITLPGTYSAATIYNTLLNQDGLGARTIVASDLTKFGLNTEDTLNTIVR